MDCGRIPMDDDERHDQHLRALFQREQPRVADQPFVNEVAQRVAASRRRQNAVTLAAQAIAIGALIAASPWLVSGSALLSTKLDQLFASTANALDSPYGYGAGAVCFAVVALVFRRRLFG
jgi:hypothetical protein